MYNIYIYVYIHIDIETGKFLDGYFSTTESFAIHGYILASLNNCRVLVSKIGNAMGI